MSESRPTKPRAATNSGRRRETAQERLDRVADGLCDALDRSSGVPVQISEREDSLVVSIEGYLRRL